jgi:uncharacterized membrane protein YqjE
LTITDGLDVSLSIGPQTFRLLRRTKSLAANMRALGRDILELARLEARLAVASAVSIGIFSAVALVLVCTGWILLVAALVAWVAANWLSLHVTLLIVGLIMLAGAIPCALIIRSRAGNLGFKATRRELGRLSDGR